MTTTFLPIEATWSEPGVLVVVGSGAVPGAQPGGAQPGAADPQTTSQALAEMASSDLAGTVEIVVAGEQVQVTARVVDPTAAEKCRRNVYTGFAITTLAAADGSQRVRRVALADSPSGFGKSALLKIGKAPTVKSPSVLINDIEVRLAVRQAKDRAAEAARISKAGTGLPGGNPPYREAAAQWQGTSTTAGGRGTDLAPFGQDQGIDRCQASIRAALAKPFAGSEGLLTMLGGR